MKCALSLACLFYAISNVAAKVPALEEDQFLMDSLEQEQAKPPSLYIWSTITSGVSFPTDRSNIGGWLRITFSLTAATPTGYLLVLRYPEAGFPPPQIIFQPRYLDSKFEQDSLIGGSVLIGRRKLWKHGHISIAGGAMYAQGVRVYSHDVCTSFFSGCTQILERKKHFEEVAPTLLLEAVTGWRYFQIGMGLDLLGTRNTGWGWHISMLVGRIGS